jgi:hypothetical protein
VLTVFEGLNEPQVEAGVQLQVTPEFVESPVILATRLVCAPAVRVAGGGVASETTGVVVVVLAPGALEFPPQATSPTIMTKPRRRSAGVRSVIRNSTKRRPAGRRRRATDFMECSGGAQGGTDTLSQDGRGGYLFLSQTWPLEPEFGLQTGICRFCPATLCISMIYGIGTASVPR